MRNEIARIRSIVVAARDGVKATVAKQRVSREEWKALEAAELRAVRAELPPEQNAARSDNDLRRIVGERLMSRFVRESHETLKTAREMRDAARAGVQRLRSEVRRLRVPEPTATEREQLHAPTSWPLLIELRRLNQNIDRQRAEQRVARFADSPERALELLKRAEADGDLILASVADDFVAEALDEGRIQARPGEDPTAAITRERVLRQQFEAHRDQRIDPATRVELETLDDELAEADREYTSASTLQQAVQSTGRVLIEESAAV